MRRHAQRRGQAGQSMLEFAMMAVLFLGTLFAILQSSIWAIESMAATEAAENTVRLAAGDINGNVTFTAVITPTLRAAMPGTPVVALPVGTACPADPSAVWQQYGGPTVVTCVTTSGTFVTVGIVGNGNSFVGSSLGLRFLRGIPINVKATTHILTFQA